MKAFLRTLLNREHTYDELTADQDNFRLTRAIAHRFTTDASRTITGFDALTLDSQIRIIANVGDTNNLVLADNDSSSSDVNRITTHTGGDITLGPNESALIFYDRTSRRVRTIGFV